MLRSCLYLDSATRYTESSEVRSVSVPVGCSQWLRELSGRRRAMPCHSMWLTTYLHHSVGLYIRVYTYTCTTSIVSFPSLSFSPVLGSQPRLLLLPVPVQNHSVFSMLSLMRRLWRLWRHEFDVIDDVTNRRAVGIFL